MEQVQTESPAIGEHESGGELRALQPATSAPEAAGQLKAYLRKKQAVSRAVQALHEFLDIRDSKTRLEACHELQVKLAEDRFTLAVVGQFKRGKSSLMNAIIGRNLLPTGILPLTSAVTILRFGPTEKLVVAREGWSFPQEAPIAQLPDFVTERGNPGNQMQVKAVYVETPSPFLRRGLEFVDTPGIGSAIEANTRTTYEFIPDCDAVLFVTSVDTPLTKAETAFLQLLRQHVRKLFFVVNKIDLLADSEREEVLNFVTATLKRETNSEQVRIFPVSSQLTLGAKLRGEPNAVGGMAELEAALADFLTTEKASALLVAILDKALRLLKAESRELDLQTRAHQASGAALEEKLARLREKFEQIHHARRERLGQMQTTMAEELTAALHQRLRTFLEQESQKLTKEVLDWVGLARWESSDAIARGFAANIRPRLVREVSGWAVNEASAIDGQFQAEAARQKEALALDMAAVSAVAEEVFGLHGKGAEPDRDDLALTVVFQPPSVSDLNGRIRFPFVWRLIPAQLNRAWLIRLLTRLSKAWIDGIENDVVDSTRKRISQAITKLAEQVEASAIRGEQRTLDLAAARGPADPTRARPVLTDSQQEERRSQLEHRLEVLRDHLIHGETPEALDEKSPSVHVPDPVLRRKIASPHADSSPVAMFSCRNCPICHPVKQALFDFFAGWQNMLASDDAAQEAFADEWGFCPVHSWHLVTIASPIGLSMGYVRLVDRLATELAHRGSSTVGATDGIERLFAKPSTCRACRAVARAEAAQIERFCRILRDEQGPDAYAESYGLCLRHLDMALSSVHSDRLKTLLLSKAAKRFEEISEDMQSYALKRQATRGALLHRDENDAYLRALVHIVGDRYLADPTPADAEI